MDLQLHLRVLWRFRFLILCGLVLGIGLALLSFVRVDFAGAKPTLSYRQSQLWESSAVALVTEPGFPLGRLSPTSDESGRLAILATMYSYFAAGDGVQEILLRDGPLPGAVQTSPVTSADGGVLPLIRVSGTAPTPRSAAVAARRGTSALRAYLQEKQIEGRVPPAQRVLLSVLRQAEPADAVVVVPRKKTRSIVIFFTIMMAVLGLAFVLENLRPRVRLVPKQGGLGVGEVDDQRRQA